MADTAWLGTTKPIIAMVHFPPLPGSPGYDPAGGMAAITDSAARDIEALQEGGIDAVMFGNEGDRPYELQASPEALAAMAAAIATLSRSSRSRSASTTSGTRSPPWRSAPPPARPSRAKSSPASTPPTWACGSRAVAPRSSCAPSWAGRPQAALQRQRRVRDLARQPPDRGPRQERRLLLARRRHRRLGPDDRRGRRRLEICAVREAAVNVPVFANTGVRIDTVADILAVADGVVIGTHLKRDGDTWNPVDPERVRRFMDRVRSLR